MTAVGKIQSRKAGLSSSQNTTEKRSEKRRTRLVSGMISRSAGESIHDSHTYSASAKSGKCFGKNAFAAATEASTARAETAACTPISCQNCMTVMLSLLKFLFGFRVKLSFPY